MKKLTHSILTGLLLLASAIVVWTCRKDPSGLPPQIEVKFSPLQGATTDTFTFDASETLNPNRNSKLYFQWDYGIDGKWNTLPSKSAVQKFRFFKAGDYQVRVKAITADGVSDSMLMTVPVEQGYSKPRPSFQTSHDTANIFTEITFDASMTKDDEDSLSGLQFRWDFNSDGYWELPFSGSPTATFRYASEGKYLVTLLVKDPSELVAYAKKQMVVNLRDPDLIVDFTWSPEKGTVADTFLFDGSASHHPKYPAMILSYRWQVEEGVGWSEESKDPTLIHRFHTTRTQFVRLRVVEDRGLYNDLVKPIYLDPANQPPKAGFQSSINYGNVTSLIYLSGWLCKDPEDLTSELEVRWDFEGDGNWDTGYSKEKIIYHRWDQAGNYGTTIQVRDSKGLTDKFTDTMRISPNQNETGMIMDTRDGQLYGTVKVGDQWWFAENLKYEIPAKLENQENPGIWEPWKVWLNFLELPKWSEPFGKYYHIAGAMVNKEQGSNDDPDFVYALCPRGWHVPTRADIEELKNHLGANQMAEKLEIGGETDFNLQYLGYVDWHIIWKSMFTPLDTVYTFKETYQWAYLYSYEQHEQDERVDTWAIKVKRHTHDYWEGWNTTKYFVPIRCIKD